MRSRLPDVSRPQLHEPLERLSQAWLDAVQTPRRRAYLAAAFAIVTTALLVAREGTVRARVLAAIAIAAVLAAGVVLRLRERRILSNPTRVLRRVAGHVDPERAARALRALSLLDGEVPRDSGTSAELARLHVERSLQALPRDRVASAAARLGFWFSVSAIVLIAMGFSVFASNAWGVFEGADVLVARDGVAPFDMRYLAEVDIRARPPEYLHSEERRVLPFEATELPRGTMLTVRGRPVHDGRKLALSDGHTEIPMVDDGAGRLVARWPLADSVPLRVIARFGDIVIQEPEATQITSIPDEAPIVTLEGAPKQVLLLELEDGGDIPLRYEATDDHGLREVHLVLRSGAREERRVLARLDGETRADRGGYVLRARDAFVRKSHAPIEVRVEAKDNDPITGPKWGASPAIMLIPPDVGEPEARRLEALRKLRDAFVDVLAFRTSRELPTDAKERRAFVAEELRGDDEMAELLEATLTSPIAGIRVPGRLQAILRAQMTKARDAMAAEARKPSASTHAALVKATERLVLVTDSVIRGLGFHDTREAARQLAEVADDLALGAAQVQRVGERERGATRMDASDRVLEGGSKSMRRMGSLGRDLGEIVHADVARVRRARAEENFVHAELAARDLAARLRQPDPSFGSRGKSGHAGGESGGGRGTVSDSPDATDVERAFNEAAQDLERLAQDHATGIGGVEQALSGASSADDVKALGDEAKRRAQAVREAAEKLPSVGGGSDTWSSKGAAAREHAESMARALEHGNPADAVSSGRSAMAALEEAKRSASRQRWLGFGEPFEGEAERRINDARQKLEPELKWAEQKLDALRKKAAERAGAELARRGDDEEKLADRAQSLGQRGREQGSLPAPALDSLGAAESAAREAARALKRGDADKALEHQRDAQRLLEMARESLGDSGEGERGEGGDANVGMDHADIPKADSHKGPEEFRRRVVKGLGQPSSGRLKDAVRRYAEGLLR
jgi:hypothetical protein